MPKQHRAAASRSPGRPAARKSSKGARLSKPSSRPGASASAKSPRVKSAKAKAPAKAKPLLKAKARAAATARVRTPSPTEPAPKEVATPPAPPRRPAFYEALAVYETGVRALQRHDFQAAADSLRGVIQGYPSERELVERAKLYLQVCERETARRPSGPQTPSEWVYAATVALNSGDVEGALGHLTRALDKAPESDHAHYIMAVALTDKGDTPLALVHLRHAITLNPDNRSVALQDPDLRVLHDLELFHQALEASDASARRRVKARR